MNNEQINFFLICYVVFIFGFIGGASVNNSGGEESWFGIFYVPMFIGGVLFIGFIVRYCLIGANLIQ